MFHIFSKFTHLIQGTTRYPCVSLLSFQPNFCQFYYIQHLFCELISVIQQFYQTRVNDEFVLIGNSASLKCLIPSFVADFVFIVEWLDEEGTSYTSQAIGTYHLTCASSDLSQVPFNPTLFIQLPTPLFEIFDRVNCRLILNDGVLKNLLGLLEV